MEITITVNAPGLTEAITKLALAIDGKATAKVENGEVVIPAGTPVTVQEVSRTETAPQNTTAPTPAAQPTSAPQASTPATQPQPTPAPAVMPQATQPTPAPQQPAAQQGKALTLDDLARAGAGLVDKGQMPQVITLLGKYGVQAITQLQPESFEAFAGELRALGAAI